MPTSVGVSSASRSTSHSAMPRRVQYLRGLGGGENLDGRRIAFRQIDAQALQARGRCLRAGIVDADMTGESGHSGRRLEALEPERKTVSIGPVLIADWQMDRAAVQSLQGFEHRAVVLPEQPLRHMQPIIRVNADQMCVERRMMNFREWDTVRNHRLAELLILVRDDMGGVEQQ